MRSFDPRWILLPILIGGLGACRTAHSPTPGASTAAGSPPPVYMAGFVNEAGRDGACSWIGSGRTVLPVDGASSAQAHSVFLSPTGLIYTAGFFLKDGRSVPCRWTGSIRTELHGDQGGAVNSVFVSSYGWPYQAGYYSDRSGIAHPCVWEGSARIELPSGEGGIATSVFIYKNKVYTSGFRSEGARKVACYWTNTSRTDLPCGESGVASSIFVSDGVVYAAGSYYDGSQYVPCYWTAAGRTDLPGSSRARAEARSIFVRDQVVYTAGVSGFSACYWKGTTQDNLPAPPSEGLPGVLVSANAISVVGDEVYTAGSYQAGVAAQEAPCYWVGTSFVDLGAEANGAKNIGAVLSIFVPNQ